MLSESEVAELIKEGLRYMVKDKHLNGWYSYTWGTRQWCITFDGFSRTMDDENILAYIDMYMDANE